MTAVHSLPRLTIRVDGNPLDAEQASALRRVRVVQMLSAPAQCELVFQAPGERLASGGFAPGTDLEVELDDRDIALFSGEVTATEHVYTSARWLEIRVRAHDPLHRLQKRQAARALTEVDIAGLARELLSDAGVSASVQAGDASVIWPLLLQHDQTDFELLREVCERSARYFVMRDDTLHVLTLEGISGGAPTLTLGSELIEATFELNAASGYRRVVARGWDPARALALEARAESAQSGRSAEATAEVGDVGGNDERLLGGVTGASEAHAQLMAQAELDRSAASELTLRGTALGDPALRPGACITVEGVADHLAGDYVLTEVVHTIDPEIGYQSVLSSRPPPPPPRSAVPGGMALAKVTAVDDPEGLGRVRVQLPAFGNLETGWIQVLGLGAGSDKGLAILPDIDDQVLVSLIPSDLGQAIVLGGLYGDRNPDPGIEGGNTRRFSLQTSGGQRLVFDDKNEMIRIADAKGSYLEISKDRVLLHSEQPLTIEAPGKSLVLRASSIDFERR